MERTCKRCGKEIIYTNDLRYPTKNSNYCVGARHCLRTTGHDGIERLRGEYKSTYVQSLIDGDLF